MGSRLLRIFGQVQGVYYRDTAVSKALEMGVNGWVRNRTDGTVEALVVGDDERVNLFIAWAKIGPVNARVERVEVLETQVPEASHQQFVRLPTA